MKKTANYQAFLIERLRKDEVFREEYLNEALRDENQRLILLALRNVAQATGGLSRLSKSTGLNRQHLYRTLSKAGNPSWERIVKIFHDIGYPLRAVSNRNLVSSGMPKGKGYSVENGEKLHAMELRESRAAYGKRQRKQ